MSGLKDLRLNGLKDLKINGLRYLRIDELKHLIHKHGSRDDKEIGDLMKSKKEVEVEIRKLLKEKKEIESRISQLRKVQEGQVKEISEFPLTEEIFPPLRRNMRSEMPELLEVETGALQREDTEVSEGIYSQEGEKNNKSLGLKEAGEIEEANITEIKVKEETKFASEKKDLSNNEETDFSNIRKKDVEMASPENTDKIKTADPVPEKNGQKEGPIPEKSKNESEKPAQMIFGSNLIEELLESDDLCPEEDHGFIKYIGESSVVDLIADLKEVKRLITGTRS